MTSIWAFLLQTIYVSLTAGVILLLKKILEDKLSSRWQYGIWGILALRMVIPVSWNGYVLLPVTEWVELLRFHVESALASAYSTSYQPPVLYHVFPMPLVEPRSVTDWLFLIYVAGVVLMLLWYLFSYVRLRLLLRKGRPASEQIVTQINMACEKYELKSCRCVVVDGLKSAFVCGVFSPVLVIGAESDADEKIILHELLHLKYKDALQNIGWSILRSLHWCNPWMHMVINRIENDMESLCDQRVLERLHGEERREYGVALLGMANDKYARTFGTSSISNGGKNIARRIEAIVRFKKYPEGMSLVSVCIALVLGAYILAGTEYTYANAEFYPQSNLAFEVAMTKTKLARCSTMAGALDTYAKGIMTSNGLYIAIASPLDDQETIREEMLCDGSPDSYLYPGDEWLYHETNLEAGYRIFDLKEIGEKHYQASIGVERQSIEDEAVSTVLIPVEVYYENGWVVEEGTNGQGRMILEDSLAEVSSIGYELAQEWNSKEGECGTVRIFNHVMYEIEDYETSYQPYSWNFYHLDLNLDAEFSYVEDICSVEYVCRDWKSEDGPKEYVGIAVLELDSIEEKLDWEIMVDEKSLDEYMKNSELVSGSSTDGYSFSKRRVTENWNGLISVNGGGGGYGGAGIEPVEMPAAYAIRIYWDGVLVEEFVVEGVQDGE